MASRPSNTGRSKLGDWPAEAKALIWAALITAVFSFLGSAVTLLGNAIEKKKADREAVLVPKQEEPSSEPQAVAGQAREGPEGKDSVALPDESMKDRDPITSAGFPGLKFSRIGAAGKVFKAPSEGILFIVANAQAEGGEAFRSYLDLLILADDKICGQSRTYLPTDWRVGHLVNATCMLPVLTGQTLNLRLDVKGEGVKSTSAEGKYAFVGAG